MNFLNNTVDQATQNLEGLLRLNLQYFAEPSEEDKPDGEDKPPEDQKPKDPSDDKKSEDDKTFTQEDVNKIAAKEKKSAKEAILKELGIEDFDNAKDGMKKFKEWQDSQKTEQEKQQEKLNNLSKEKDSLSTENQDLKAQLSAMKKGVLGDSVEDVVALAKQRVSDDVTIDEAIDQIIEKYPHFAGKEEEEPNSPQIVTPGNPNGGSRSTDNNPFAAKLAKYKK